MVSHPTEVEDLHPFLVGKFWSERNELELVMASRLGDVEQDEAAANAGVTAGGIRIL